MMNKLISLFFVLLVLACKPNGSIPQNFDWLIGKWLLQDGKIEKWNKINDLSYQGMVFESDQEDANISEYIRLYRLDDLWHFEAIVPNQNKGNAILFKESKASASFFIVENKQHDFPKSIKYEHIDSTRLKVTLNEGLENVLSVNLSRVEELE